MLDGSIQTGTGSPEDSMSDYQRKQTAVGSSGWLALID